MIRFETTLKFETETQIPQNFDFTFSSGITVVTYVLAYFYIV